MLSEQIKELEENYEKVTSLVQKQSAEIVKLKDKINAFKECGKMMIPVKIYTHKKRRNTTVVFMDGSSVTVKRKQGEKDCIETAIAYCLLKQCLSQSDIKKLIEEREEH